MLVNVVFASAELDPMLSALFAAISGGAERDPPRQLAKGVYEIDHFNGDSEIDRSWWLGDVHQDMDARYPNLGEIKTYNFPDGLTSVGSFGSYGVCDSYEQILEKCPEISDDPKRGFSIFVTKLRKDVQSSEGGWRWHKWGEYIGSQDPQCEYLYDEPVIEQVYTFHVYEVINKESLKEAGVVSCE